MRHACARALVIALGVVAAGCASSDEWQTWQTHPAHFASARHLAFSMQSRGDDASTVQERDVAAARDEGWWGRVVAELAPPANVTGTWRGAWRGRGIFETPRSADAEVSFTQIGGSGTGRLHLRDTLAADVPRIITDGGSWGVGAPVFLVLTRVAP
jgi:hypothetical protein